MMKKEVVIDDFSIEYDGKLSVVIYCAESRVFENISIDNAKVIISILSDFVKNDEEFEKWKLEKE